MSTRADPWPAGGMQLDWTLSVVPSTQHESGRDLPLSGLDDRRVVEACLGGRVEAFDVIVEPHQRAIYQCASASCTATKTRRTSRRKCS